MRVEPLESDQRAILIGMFIVAVAVTVILVCMFDAIRDNSVADKHTQEVKSKFTNHAVEVRLQACRTIENEVLRTQCLKQ